MTGITWAALSTVDVEPARRCGASWDALARTADDRADELLTTVKKLPGAWPDGPASEAAGARLRSLRGELDSAYVPVATVAQALSDWADGISELRAQAQRLTEDARTVHVTVAADGSMRMDDGHADASTAQCLSSLVYQRDGLLKRAAELDTELAGRIGQNTASVAGTPAARVDPSTIPPRGSDPKAVKQWWDSLTPAQQRYLISTYPDQIGWLDGVPAASRDIANRLVLDQRTDELTTRRDEITAREKYIQDMIDQGRISEVYPDASDPRTAADTELMHLADERGDVEGKLRGMGKITDRLADPTKPRAYLLGLSTQDDGKAIVAVGNPDLADNVVTYVPGTGADLSKVGGDITRTDIMAADAAQADPTSTTAAVFWLGYDAPDSIPSAGSKDYAKDGAGDLDAFQTGLRVTHEGEASRNTVLGHSYGSTVIGHAALSSQISADAVVFVASPGVDVNHASDLTGVQPSQVYATRADNDIIRRIPDWDIIHGDDPTGSGFGAQVFSSDPGDPDNETGTHSAYWDKGNIARRNIAFIVTGQTDRLG